LTARVQAWVRQGENDLAMAEFARDGGFHAQACYHCSQAAEKALKGLLIALGEEPPRSHALERLVDALTAAGLPVDRLRQLPLKSLSRMTTASPYPDGDEAPMDLFESRDCALALETAEAVLRLVQEALNPAAPQA
jgi:HEPN domain-containing protein